MKHNIAPFHYLTQDLPGISHESLAQAAVRGGVKWIQLRIKNQPLEEIHRIAAGVKRICELSGTTLIINDHVEIARDIAAHGVHLGLDDMPVHLARKMLGDDFIIGATANRAEDVAMHLRDGADYIGLGPFRFTSTKSRLAPILGLEGISGIASQFPGVPLIAIGGIRLEDIPTLAGISIHGIAVSSAVGAAEDREQTASRFVRECSVFNTSGNTNDHHREKIHGHL